MRRFIAVLLLFACAAEPKPVESASAAPQSARVESDDATRSAAWRAPPSTVLIREEREFHNGDIRLAGTLILPANRSNLGAVVVFHGSATPLRTSPLYAHLVETLPSLGIAVFLFDRRGSGASGGVREGASFDDLADDGLAAIELLRQDRRIDADRIGVWGLSQGGWLAVLAATRSPHVKYAVSISAPMVTPDVQMMFSSTNMLRVFGYSQADITQMRKTRAAVDTYMRGRSDRETAQRAVDAARTKPWFRYLYMRETVSDRAVSGWRREIEHDPMVTLERVRTPLLILYGATDPVVPVETSVARLTAVTLERQNIEFGVIANADHHMQIGIEPRVLLDPDHDDEARPEAPEYFAVLTNWLTTHGIARRSNQTMPQ
jgi:uncharacterized protein